MPAPPVPTAEIGHVASWGALSGYVSWGLHRGLNPGDNTEATAEWVWPASLQTVDRMLRCSSVQATWWALTLPLRGDIWALDPQGARPEVVERVADDFDLPVLDDRGRRQRRTPLRRRGRFSWSHHVALAVDCLAYGHMGFEQVYDADALAETGQARLRKLAPRFPHSVSELKVDPDGGLASIRQWADRGIGQTPPIPVDRLVWYSHERKGANWFGRSVFRSAYGDFVLLDRLVRVRAQTIERNGMGIPIGIAPEGVTDQARIDEYGDLAMKARAGEFSGIGLPHGADVRFRGVEGSLPSADAAIADHRTMVAQSVQAQFMQLGRTESGNRALGETFMDFFAQALNTVGANLADVATQHAVEDYVDLNWGTSEQSPAVVAMPVDVERDLPPESLVALLQAGAIQPDDDIESFLRNRYRLPAKVLESPGVPTPDGPPTLAEDQAVA